MTQKSPMVPKELFSHSTFGINKHSQSSTILQQRGLPHTHPYIYVTSLFTITMQKLVDLDVPTKIGQVRYILLPSWKV